jgi:hypothetical protein
VGVDPGRLRQQIEFAKRIGVILLEAAPESADGGIPMRGEIAHSLRAVVGELENRRFRLAIDNSRIPAQDLNQLIEPIRSLWLGVAIDTAKPLAIPQEWHLSVRVLAYRTMSLHLKDFVVHPGPRGMGFNVIGCPVGEGKLDIPWLVKSFAALRITPSALVELWTPEQNTLEETIALEDAWAKQSVDYVRRFVPD